MIDEDAGTLALEPLGRHLARMLRFEPPPLQACRYVARDTEWYGRTVPAGSHMALLVASANRDERRIDDPACE